MNFGCLFLKFLLHLTTATIVFTAAVQPEESRLYNYIVHVSGVCPSHTDSPAEIVVITDLPTTKPFAVCKNNKIVYFTEVNKSKWKISIHFIPSTVEQLCQFIKSGSRQSYFVKIRVPITPNLLTSDIQTHIVTCNYEPVLPVLSQLLRIKGHSRSMTSLVEEPHQKTEIKSNIILYMTNIYGKQINAPLRIGSPIQLVAELLGDFPDEPSFKVVSCRAIGIIGEFYFLSKGCGNGDIFKENQGFITNGKKIISPVFPAFGIRGSSIVDFDCSFVLCDRKCDGNSCLAANLRRKRAVISINMEKTQQFEQRESVNSIKFFILNKSNSKTKSETKETVKDLFLKTRSDTQLHQNNAWKPEYRNKEQVSEDESNVNTIENSRKRLLEDKVEMATIRNNVKSFIEQIERQSINNRALVFKDPEDGKHSSKKAETEYLYFTPNITEYEEAMDMEVEQKK